MQKQRFELKYLISEETALRVREFVQCYLDFDEYSVGKPNYSYAVHSVYLDTDDLKTYWDTINGDKNRFKLRMRFYSAHPDTPIFFEMKRRMNNCMLKQRGAVQQRYISTLLSGQLPQRDYLVSNNPNHFAALQNICRLINQLNAKPKIHIAYEREAYVNEDDTVRLTMDREVRAEPNLDMTITTHMERPHRSFSPDVILELKFTNRFPDWFGYLVRVFNVMQCGAAKYVESIQKVGARQLHAPHPVVDEATPLARSW